MSSLASRSRLLLELFALVLTVAVATIAGAGCASDSNGPPADAAPHDGDREQAAEDAGVDGAVDSQPPDSTVPDSTVDSAPPGPWKSQVIPAKVQLNAVWGTSANDIYAVGNGGIILHWDGKLWEVMNNTEAGDLHAVYGVSKNRIFAVGESIGVSYALEECLEETGNDGGSTDPCPPGQYCDKDGYCKPGTWKKVYGSSHSLRGVWGTAENDVWAVGLGGRVAHRTSATSTYWTSVYDFPVDGDLNAIIGFGADEIFIAGAGGKVVKGDGKDWEVMQTGVTSDLQAIWGQSSSELYAVGFDGAVVHYDGSKWTKLNANTQSYLYGVWGSSAKDVWVVGHSVFAQDQSIFHYDGSKWTNRSPQFEAGGLNGVFVPAANQVFVVGSFSLLHYEP